MSTIVEDAPKPEQRTTVRYAKGKQIHIIGLNDASAERHDRLAGHLSGEY